MLANHESKLAPFREDNITGFHVGFLAILGSSGIVISCSETIARLNCFITGLCEHQVHRFRSKLLKAPDTNDPLLMISLWLEVFTDTRIRRCNYRKMELERIQLKTGMHSTIEEMRLKNQPIDIDSLTNPASNLFKIYNFVNQRDSLVNINHAAASRQLAELSLHDSSLIRSISLNSNKVALLTRKDSTDMRAIAAVTLAFLPPTFIAVSALPSYRASTDHGQTIFSTSFFNFQPSNDGKIISHWIWLYAAIATTLTAFFLAGWYVSSRRSQRAVQRAFDVQTPDTSGLYELP
ncbi:hypothetical protein EJ04DRAFT_529207 [Polyplosphaeria fusca]|uniref:Uncharacterized protein n=1 Tax=Polyplosphaeria fusca TaxID=682080 RepID=A0A9P4UWB3_9PLEO|nr:hypothetical protein EJ04DRAFT_529207 [Polyplosphaeria fusca]